jgi:tetratricopeptide (TPR) repeat protein
MDKKTIRLFATALAVALAIPVVGDELEHTVADKPSADATQSGEPGISDAKAAYKAYVHGQKALAIQLYSTAISKGLNTKQTAIAYSGRGALYEQTGNLQKAIDDLTKAISLDQGFEAAYYNRGVAYQDAGLLDKAILDFTEALSLDQKDSAVYQHRAHVYERLGENKAALADLTEMITLRPSEHGLYNERGLFYFKHDDYEHAIKDYDKEIELSPTFAYAYYMRASSEFSLGLFAKADEDFRLAFEHHALDHEILLGAEKHVPFWRYLSRRRAGLPDAQTLLDGVRSEADQSWPHGVAEFLLGNASADSLLAQATSSQEKCQALTYIGERNLLEEDQASAYNRFAQMRRDCSNSNPTLSPASGDRARATNKTSESF